MRACGKRGGSRGSALQTAALRSARCLALWLRRRIRRKRAPAGSRAQSNLGEVVRCGSQRRASDPLGGAGTVGTAE
eukprot:6274655-Lingulodinium_polyedra.AAC.1